MKKTYVFGILIFVCATAVGVLRAVASWDGVIFVSNAKYLQGERFPAAIQSGFDYSQFEGEPLRIRSLKRLVSDAQVIAKRDQVGIELGHFVTPGQDGHVLLACEYYEKVTLQFEGQGVMESGEMPTMTIEAPCEISSNINRIETIWIPFARLMKENEKPARFLEVSYPEQHDVYFKFDNMTSEWPHEWTLKSVRLYSEGEHAHEAKMSTAEIRDVLNRNFILKF